jgi:hypothetical protein
VDNVGKLALGELERTDVPRDQTNGRMRGQVGRTRGECRWIASEDMWRDPQREAVIGFQKRLQQPAAEKPGASSDKQSPSADFVPKMAGPIKYLIEIRGKCLHH